MPTQAQNPIDVTHRPTQQIARTTPAGEPIDTFASLQAPSHSPPVTRRSLGFFGGEGNYAARRTPPHALGIAPHWMRPAYLSFLARGVYGRSPEGIDTDEMEVLRDVSDPMLATYAPLYATPYSALPITHLQESEKDEAMCCISLLPLDALQQPVAVRRGVAVQVYEWAYLKHWFQLRLNQDPTTRQVVSVDSLFRIVKS
jgi:hypothetical protein